jgi:hypothetical protein
MLENVKKINIKDFVYWTTQAWEQSEHNDQDSNLQKRKNKLITYSSKESSETQQQKLCCFIARYANS